MGNIQQGNKMTFITFGSNHLENFDVYSMSVMLQIENRNVHMKDEELGIKEKFAFEYPMTKAKELAEKYNMKLYTREELLALKY